MKDSWHIGPRMRYWRKRRGMTIEALAGLLSVSPSKIQAVESGYRPFNRLDDLIRLAAALHVDLGSFLCDPVPGVADDDHAQVLALLRDAFLGHDPREGLARPARRLPEADAGDDLMLVVLPGGRWKVVNRRDAIKLGAALASAWPAPCRASTLIRPGSWPPTWRRRTVSLAGVNALRAITTPFRRLDDEIGPAGLRPLVLGAAPDSQWAAPRWATRGGGYGSEQRGRRTRPTRRLAVVRPGRLRCLTPRSPGCISAPSQLAQPRNRARPPRCGEPCCVTGTGSCWRRFE
jgi:transcriptional regulator with XRE-family HTH domain